MTTSAPSAAPTLNVPEPLAGDKASYTAPQEGFTPAREPIGNIKITKREINAVRDFPRFRCRAFLHLGGVLASRFSQRDDEEGGGCCVFSVL
jgi:hypothetical protein